MSHWLHGFSSMSLYHGVRVTHALHTLDVDGRVNVMPYTNSLHARLGEPPWAWGLALPLRREWWTGKHALRSGGPWWPKGEKKAEKINYISI